MDAKNAEELVRRMAAALRGRELYAPAHPLVQRRINALHNATASALQASPTVVVGFIGDEVVVDGTRLPRGSASLVGFARALQEREVEKITFARGLTRGEIRALVTTLTDRTSPGPLIDRLNARGVRHITLGKIVVEDGGDEDRGIAAARCVHATAVETAEHLWQAAKAGDQPDPAAARKKIGSRDLNLCTMIVSIADVFDALRSNRVYRQGLPTARIRAILSEQDSPAFNQVLLKRFINLVGLFPVGNLVRLSTDELGVVTAEHPTDPFRPQVKIIIDEKGEQLENPLLVNTWDSDTRGAHSRAVVDALDPEPLGIDPLQYL